MALCITLCLMISIEHGQCPFMADQHLKLHCSARAHFLATFLKKWLPPFSQRFILHFNLATERFISNELSPFWIFLVFNALSPSPLRAKWLQWLVALSAFLFALITFFIFCFLWQTVEKSNCPSRCPSAATGPFYYETEKVLPRDVELEY